MQSHIRILFYVLILIFWSCSRKNSKAPVSNQKAQEQHSSDTRTVTDHAGNSVEVPSDPKRIASLHTLSASVMLIDLGAPLIGTATRIKKSTNKPYIRGVEEVFGIKFEDTNYFNYGKAGSDMEQIKASKPDLIVGNIRKHKKNYDQLATIAPTVLIDSYENPNIFEVYEDLAAWIGLKDTFDAKYLEYKNRLAAMKAEITSDSGEKTFVYALPYTNDGAVRVIQHRGALTKVAYDLGFKQLDFIRQQLAEDEGRGMFSPELMGQLDADYFLTTYSEHSGEDVNSIYNEFEKLAPGWKDYLSAYKNDTLIPFNREIAGVNAFRSYHYVLDEFAKHIKS